MSTENIPILYNMTEYLSNEKTLKFTSFTTGFILYSDMERSTENPFLCSLVGVAGGYAVSFWTVYVAKLMPENTQFLLNLPLISAIGYRIYKKFQKTCV
jgi:hypothetical protein